MPNYTYSRISITLPPEVLAAADRLAKEHDRPRSWVFAEAIRRFGGPAVAVPALAREAEPDRAAPVAPEQGDDRLDRLADDLALSPEERVRAAEQLAMVERPERESGQGSDQILFFNRFEEYLRWDQRSRSAS